MWVSRAQGKTYAGRCLGNVPVEGETQTHASKMGDHLHLSAAQKQSVGSQPADQRVSEPKNRVGSLGDEEEVEEVEEVEEEEEEKEGESTHSKPITPYRTLPFHALPCSAPPCFASPRPALAPTSPAEPRRHLNSDGVVAAPRVEPQRYDQRLSPRLASRDA
ncbi:hypothetical protein O3P69_017226 [Scylla paramamosain]|uniref:Uncharacterized protein n=1 Tax=Scylla paramamosain TaxID=85552 RepID=A0AAW0TUR8_SCYPA